MTDKCDFNDFLKNILLKDIKRGDILLAYNKENYIQLLSRHHVNYDSVKWIFFRFISEIHDKKKDIM